MILPAAADVAIIRHIARAVGATSHGVTLATRGHTCAGNVTDRGMNSKIAASSSLDTEVPVAMVDLSNTTEMLTPCNATEHAPSHELRMMAAVCALLSSVYLHHLLLQRIR